VKGRTIDDDALVLSDRDNVATALAALDAGRTFELNSSSLVIREMIPFGHKFALEPLEAGDEIYKYGEVIGEASRPVGAGEWVHTHNCESRRGRGDLEPTPSNDRGQS
jgi:altronate dehydratase small subunit